MPENATATNTLVPTRTPTVTNTPKPAETWATINEELGVYLREGPCSDNEQCPTIPIAIGDKRPVQVLSFSADKNWAQVRDEDNRVGWIHIKWLLFEQ